MFPPPILFIFGFKHKPTFICPFCAQTPCVCGYIFFLKQAQQSLCNVLKERRTETKKERQTEREPNTWGANNKLKFTENLYKKNISTQTSESDVSKSLISICTFKKKKLYNSIIVQIPAPISKGCLVQEKKKKKTMGKVNQQEHGLWSSARVESRMGYRHYKGWGIRGGIKRVGHGSGEALRRLGQLWGVYWSSSP